MDYFFGRRKDLSFGLGT